MAGEGFIARVQQRRRWRSLAAITLVLGLGAGVATSLIAGARRSASVVDRYYAKTIPYDFQLFAPALSAQQVRTLPGVVRADPTTYLGMMQRRADGSLGGGINGLAFPRDTLDPTIKFLAGRFPAPGDIFGAVVNRSFEKEFGVRLGDTVDVQMFSNSDRDSIGTGEYNPHGPRYRFHITGIVRTPVDVTLDEIHGVTTSAYGATNNMFVPFEFYEAHHTEFLDFGLSYGIQLADARDRAAFDAAVQRALPKGSDPPAYDSARFQGRRASLVTPTGMETTVLLTLGIAVALGVALVVGLLLRAEQRVVNQDDPALRALGMTSSELGTAAAWRTIPVAVFGALLTVVTALALSARYPIGTGRQLELNPGTQINAAVIVSAVALVVAFTIACAFFFGSHSGRSRHAPAHRTRLAEWLSRSGAPNDVVVGTHFAFERRTANGSFPSRQAVVGGAVALAIVAGVGVFIGGVDHVYASPTSHGWPWDVAIGNVNFQMRDAILHRLVRDPRLIARTTIRYGQATVDGASREVLAFDPGGTAPPGVLRGRLPRSASEIAIGSHLLGGRTHLGATVEFTVANGEYDLGKHPTRTVRLTVVGVALPPIFGEADLGDVSVVTFDAIARSGGSVTPEFVLARVAGPRDATVAALRHDYTPEMLRDVVPARIVNLHQVRTLPIVGAGLAGALAVVLLAFTLTVSVRLRARELGTLRALGYSARHLMSVLWWQAMALAVVVLVFGIPLGELAGTALWRIVAHQLGIGDAPSYPAWVWLLVPAALAAAVVCSLVPARRARRAHVAQLLRAE